MAVFTDNFRVSNNEDWKGAWSLTRGADLPAPWLGLPEFVPGGTYTSSSAMTRNGDLYVARPVVPAIAWTAASTFGTDVDVTGQSRWVLVGAAAAWAQTPVDLTGASLRFALWPSDEFGNLIGDYPALIATSGTGEAPILNAAGGGYGLAIPVARVRGVAPGAYRYDFVATYADGTTDRFRYGLWYVDQGIA